jgi:hypothetical protein
MIILHAVTNDGPDGQPWPPPDGDTLWTVVRRADGCTLWRAIHLLKSGPLPRMQFPKGSDRNGEYRHDPR